MGLSVAQWSLITSIFSACIAVSCAVVSWRWVSRSIALRKWARGLVMTRTSDARQAATDAELAELHSTLQKLTTTVRRLSSRAGMQELRERRSAQPSTDAPPPPGDKAAARRFYLLGKSPAQVAAMHKPATADAQHHDEELDE